MANKKSTSSNTKNTTTKKTTNKKKTAATGKNENKKNGSGDAMKFLMVLVIAGIAIALLFFMQKNPEQTGDQGVSGTPAASVSPSGSGQTAPTGTSSPTPTQKAQETMPPSVTEAPKDTATPEPTKEPTKAPTVPPTATPVPEATKAPALTAKEAQERVEAAIAEEYTVQLINDHLRLGDSEFYLFCALGGGEILYPFLAVDAQDGVVYCYDSSADAIFELTTFPIIQEEPVMTQAPEEPKTVTAQEAYEILCTYSKESLNIAKNVSEYDAEYGTELTLINGINCYRINLSEIADNGKVRNRGVFFVSVDGTRCYYENSETSEFILVR